MKLKNALVFGSTGLTGSKLIYELLNDDRYEHIRLINRKSIGLKHEKLQETLLSFEQLEEHKTLFEVDEVYICLGTTIKKAGSKKQFEYVDFDLPKRIARISKESNVDCLLMISSIGASIETNNFYLKTKGKAEKAVFDLGPKRAFIVRPSIILGERKEKRTGEMLAKWLMKQFEFLLIGSLRKYRGIYPEELAKALIFIANSRPSKSIIESEELIAIGRE